MYCFTECWPCFATIQQALSNTGAEDITPIFSEIARLIMIGKRTLKLFHAAVMRVLVESVQPPDSPIMSASYLLDHFHRYTFGI